MKVKSQLEDAQLQNVTSNPTPGKKGLVQFNTVSGVAVIDDGSAVRTVVTTDNTQTLSNKTLNDLGNVSNNHVAIIDGDGDLASEATLAVSRGGTNIASYTTGDVLYASGATTLSKLAIGTSGTFLKSNGSAVVWDTAGATLATTSKTANYTATTADNLILCDDTSASFTITLYAASGNAGRQLIIKKTNTTIANTVTIDGNASETIDGSTTTTLNTQNETVYLICDGTNWQIIDRRIDGKDLGLSFTANNLTTTNVTVASFRVGKYLFVESYGQVTGSSASTLSFSLPTGITIDTSLVSSVSKSQVLGALHRIPTSTASIPNTSTGPFAVISDAVNDVTKVFVALTNGTNANQYNAANATAVLVNGEAYSLTFKIPVSEWKA